MPQKQVSCIDIAHVMNSQTAVLWWTQWSVNAKHLLIFPYNRETEGSNGIPNWNHDWQFMCFAAMKRKFIYSLQRGKGQCSLSAFHWALFLAC